MWGLLKNKKALETEELIKIIAWIILIALIGLALREVLKNTGIL